MNHLCQKIARSAWSAVGLPPLLTFIFFGATLSSYSSDLQPLPVFEPQIVFSGPSRKIQVLWQNSTDKTISADVRYRLYQTSSSTLMPMGESQPWKNLQVLPGQTVLETTSFDFPQIRAITAFQIHWLEGSNELGKTTVQVCPETLLRQLSALAGANGLGVLDPENQLKPLLDKMKIHYENLDENGWNAFKGKLALAGPLAANKNLPENFEKQLLAASRKGVTILWLQPPKDEFSGFSTLSLTPSGAGTVTILRGISSLSESAAQQINLLRAIELAQGTVLNYLTDIVPSEISQ